jgi:hypothetical protein
MGTDLIGVESMVMLYGGILCPYNDHNGAGNSDLDV